MYRIPLARRHAPQIAYLGADEVIDYRSEDFSTLVEDADVVFDH
jgi:NADPH:quinone reductase-like Zn-dependent oxidoreductase